MNTRSDIERYLKILRKRYFNLYHFDYIDENKCYKIRLKVLEKICNLEKVQNSLSI